MANIVKLVVALWIAKKWITDNELVAKIINNLKSEIKTLLSL